MVIKKHLLLLACISVLIPLLLREQALYFRYLNDDSALMIGAGLQQKEGTLLTLFYTSYGPRIIRPWQIFGMAAEQALFTGPAVSYAISLALFAITQLLLFIIVYSWSGSIGAFCASLLLGLSPIASEPILWLSDRHDLYLAIFMGISILLWQKLRLSKGGMNRSALHICLFASLWGAFYSNEKATALPLIIIALETLLWVWRPTPLMTFLRNSSTLLGTQAFAIVTYFALRKKVLGVWIGGYDDQVLPSTELLPAFISWGIGIIKMLWHPGGPGLETTMLIATICLTCVIGLILLNSARSFKNSRTLVGFLLIAACIITIAGLPTFKYCVNGLNPTIGNSRFWWSPLLFLCGFCGIAFDFGITALKNLNLRAFIYVLLGIYFICLGQAAYNGFLAFKHAHRATSQVVAALMDFCSCASPREAQFEGLPGTYYGVNTFTEAVWPEYHAWKEGYTICNAGAEMCKLSQPLFDSQDKLRILPLKITKTLNELLPEKLPTFQTKSNIERVTRKNGSIVVYGWGYDVDSGKPLQKVALVVENSIRIKIKPNVIREGMASTSVKSSNFGFVISIPEKILASKESILKVVGLRRNPDRSVSFSILGELKDIQHE